MYGEREAKFTPWEIPIWFSACCCSIVAVAYASRSPLCRQGQMNAMVLVGRALYSNTLVEQCRLWAKGENVLTETW